MKTNFALAILVAVAVGAPAAFADSRTYSDSERAMNERRAYNRNHADDEARRNADYAGMDTTTSGAGQTGQGALIGNTDDGSRAAPNWAKRSERSNSEHYLRGQDTMNAPATPTPGHHRMEDPR